MAVREKVCFAAEWRDGVVSKMLQKKKRKDKLYDSITLGSIAEQTGGMKNIKADEDKTAQFSDKDVQI